MSRGIKTSRIVVVAPFHCFLYFPRASMNFVRLFVFVLGRRLQQMPSQFCASSLAIAKTVQQTGNCLLYQYSCMANAGQLIGY